MELFAGVVMRWVLVPDKFLSRREVGVLRDWLVDQVDQGRWDRRRFAVERDRMVVELALGSGLRVAELRALRVGDLYFDEQFLFVVCGKNSKSRRVFLSGGLVSHLQYYLQLKKHWGELLGCLDPVLVSPRGCGRYSRGGLQQLFKRVCRGAGLRSSLSIHACRHTHLTELYRVTKNIRVVQDQAGHSSPAVTAVYAAVTGAEIRAGVDKIFSSAAVELESTKSLCDISGEM